MTSQIDDGGMHPILSSLMGKTSVQAAPTKKYDRDEMMNLRTCTLSMTRPANLSVDFNGDDGKFSPYKWLEHRWEVEGIKNRLPSKKLDSLSTGADENTGLSPQRRAFSGGCRAPDGEKSKDGHYEKGSGDRLGGNGKNWRNGSSGGAEKYASKGTDFKLPFQKTGNAQERGNRNEWRRNDKDGRAGGSKFPSNRRDERGGSVSGNEKLPEWADGPTTMDDMIELRGFDEPKKGKKKNAKEKEAKKERSDNGGGKPSTNQAPSAPATTNTGGHSSGNNSRPSSAGLNTKNVDVLEDTAITSAEIAYTSGGAPLPASDHELAELLGILDMNTDGAKKGTSDESTPAGASRLSRFFRNASSNQLGIHKSHDEQSPGGAGENVITNPMLAKILGQTPSGGQTPSNSTTNGLSALGLGNLKGGVRLEDLEKAVPGGGEEQISQNQRRSASSNSTSAPKGTWLTDPSKHAQLLDNLQRIAKEREEERQTPPTSSAPARSEQPQPTPQHQAVQAQAHVQQLLAMNSQFPAPGPPQVSGPPQAFADAHILGRFAQNPAMINAHVENQLQQAVAAAMVANNGQPIPQHLQESLRMAAQRNRFFLQQQTLAFAIAQQQHQAQLQQHGHQQGGKSRNGPVPAMIPASVQRQLNKNSNGASSSASGGDNKKEKGSSGSSTSPPDHQEAQQSASIGGDQQPAVDVAMQLKKIQMQNNYAAMMNAMQGGLGLSAWRPPPGGQAAPPPQMPQNVQMLMAQQAAAQQHQMRMMLGKHQQQHHQQALMAKLMQLQSMHQNAPLAPGAERTGFPGAPSNQHQFAHAHHHQASSQQQQTQIPTELSQVGPIQTPLEKLLASVGVQASQFTGSSQAEARLPTSARPMSLEDLERELTGQK